MRKKLTKENKQEKKTFKAKEYRNEASKTQCTCKPEQVATTIQLFRMETGQRGTLERSVKVI